MTNIIKIIPKNIMLLNDIFNKSGYKLYLIGGCIRDSYLGKIPKDYDLCTNALPDIVISLLKENNIEYNLQGEHFAVVAAIFDKDNIFEIATFRADEKVENDNRKPKVRLGVTIEDDCKRRDFTINALFLDLESKEIIDYVGGIEDLKNNIIKCVGNPFDRFEEDHLRKLRLITRMITNGFKADDNTYNAVKCDPTLNISKERIYDELMKCINICNDFSKLLFLLSDTNLLYEIFKGLTLKTCYNTSKICSINTLLYSIIDYNNKTINILQALKYPLKTIKSIEFLNNKDNFQNPLQFYNKIKSTDLTNNELLLLFDNSKEINYLLQFTPDTELSIKLIEKGFQGKELGEQINKYYINQMLNNLK